MLLQKDTFKMKYLKNRWTENDLTSNRVPDIGTSNRYCSCWHFSCLLQVVFFPAAVFGAPHTHYQTPLSWSSPLFLLPVSLLSSITLLWHWYETTLPMLLYFSYMLCNHKQSIVLFYVFKCSYLQLVFICICISIILHPFMNKWASSTCIHINSVT